MRVARLIRSGTPMLMYHNIGLVPGNSIWAGLYVSPEKFRRQLSMFRNLGYRGCSVRDAFRELRANPAARIVVLTFDDGYLDVFENALPALKDHGFTATCYFVTKFFGDYNRWDKTKSIERKPIMTVQQAAEWARLGMEIGSHSCSHPLLTDCTSGECEDEVERSKAELEDKFGERVDSFSYPFGGSNSQVASIVKAAGYTTAVTTRPGHVHADSDPFRLNRINVDGRRGMMRVLLGVSTGYHDWRASK